MSYKYLTPAWDAELPTLTKFILVSLADQANDQGECWPGVRSLSRRTGMSERSVQVHLRALEAKGFLVTVKQTRANGSARSNLYRLVFTDLVKQAHQPMQDVHQGGAPTAPPEPSGLTAPEPTLNLNQSAAQTFLHTAESKGKTKPEGIAHMNEGVPYPTVKTKDSKLVSQWKGSMCLIGIAPTVTAKEGKMLRDFAKHVGYPQAIKIIPEVVKQWEDFELHAKAQHQAWPHGGPVPSIKFLSANSQAALNWWINQCCPEPKAPNFTPYEVAQIGAEAVAKAKAAHAQAVKAWEQSKQQMLAPHN